MTLHQVTQLYSQSGGSFLQEPEVLQEKVQKIRAFLFDWDGVFNTGTKGEGVSSSFSEADSMGLNLMRFAWYKETGVIPQAAILTGENNPSAFHFAERENLHGVYFKVRHKEEALDHYCRLYGLQPENVAFFFDDVLDLGVAKRVGMRLLINRQASPVFRDYVRSENLADYITAQEGGFHGLREAAELVTALRTPLPEVFEHRIHFTETYQKYLSQRSLFRPARYTKEGILIRQV